MIVGPDLPALKARAEAALVAAMPPLASGYPLKALEARRVLDGATSDIIAAEAALRGVTPAALAAEVFAAAQAAHAAELQRVGRVLAIRAASGAAGVWAVLAAAGIERI